MATYSQHFRASEVSRFSEAASPHLTSVLHYTTKEATTQLRPRRHTPAATHSKAVIDLFTHSTTHLDSHLPPPPK